MKASTSSGTEPGRRTAGVFLVSAFVLLCTSAFPARAGSDETPVTLAVLHFANRNPGDGWDWLEKGLPDLLITDLSKSASLTVVERERMAWMLKELELAGRGIVDPAAAQNVGRICKVDWAFFGSFLGEGDQISIEAHIIEVETGRLLRVEWVEGKAEELFALEKELVHRILSRLNVPLSEEERQSISYVPTDSLDALTHYSLGLGSYEDGEYELAIRDYRLALRKDADYHQARMRLADMYFKTHEPEHALVEYREVLRKDTEGRLSEDVYYHMGRVLERGLGRYREAIECYERIVAAHPEYAVDLEVVQAEMVRRGEARYNRYYSKDEATKRAAKKTMDEFDRRYKAMQQRNRVSNRAMEQLVLCYEKMGDKVTAARHCITLSNFLRLHYGHNDRVQRKAEELYKFVLREGQDDKVPVPAEMICVPDEGIVFDSTNLCPLARLAIDRRFRGSGDQGAVYVAPPGKEFHTVRVSITTLPSDSPRLVRGVDFWEHTEAPFPWVYQPRHRPATIRGVSEDQMPPGVRAIRFWPKGATQWRVELTVGTYRQAEAQKRFGQGGFEVLAFPSQVRAMYVDGRPAIGFNPWDFNQIPFPAGEHEARVFWCDGADKAASFTVRVGEMKKINVIKDYPFVKCPDRVARHASSPNLFFDRDGDLWLCWDEARFQGEESDICFSVSSDGGRTWGEPRMSPVSALGLDTHPVLQQDRYGTYWLAWCSSRDISDPKALWISSSPDGYRWRHPGKVVLPDSQNRRFKGGPPFAFAIDPKNVFWIACWRRLWHSSDGKTWSLSASSEVRFAGSPGRFHAGAGGLTAVGVEDKHILMCTSLDGESWSVSSVIGSSCRSIDNCVFAKDAYGNCVFFVKPYLWSCRLKRAGGELSPPYPFERYRIKPFDPHIAVSPTGDWAMAYSSEEGLFTAIARNPFGIRETGNVRVLVNGLIRQSTINRRRVEINGVCRVTNVTTGLTSNDPGREGIDVAPGDHLMLTLSIDYDFPDYAWHYFWTGNETSPVAFSEAAGVRIAGILRLTNLTTGATTDEPDHEGIHIAAGNHIAATFNDSTVSECVWKGGRSLPPLLRGFLSKDELSLTRELVLDTRPAAMVVGACPYFGAFFSVSQVPKSWENHRSLVSLDFDGSSINDLSPLAVLESLSPHYS